MPKWFHLTEKTLVIIIVSVAAILRFYHYAAWSLSNDELSALSRLQFDSFGEMIRLGVMRGDFHPAGVQVFLWFWVKAFGNGVATVRLPFVIFGIMSVCLVFKIGKRLFSESTGLFAAAVIAFLQFPILYSQLARPYSPGLLFSLAMVWYWIKVVFNEKRGLKDYAGFVVFGALCAYTHHYSFLLLIVVGISGFAFYRKIQWKYYLISAFAIGVLYIPHLKIFVYQFGIGGVGGPEGWLGKPEPDWILGFFKYALNDSWILVILMFAVFLATIILKKNKFTPFLWLSLSWFVVSFFIGYFYSIYRNPILQYSILLFSFPFVILFFFSFVDAFNKKIRIATLIVFILFGTFQTVFINKFYQQQHFGEFKGVAEHISNWNRELGKENVTNTTVVNAPYYIHYYLDKLMPGIEFAQYNNRGGKDLLALTTIVKNTNTNYFAFGWTKPCPYEMEEVIKYQFPFVVEKHEYARLSAVTLFSKTKPENYIPEPEPVFSLQNDMEKPGDWNSSPAAFDSLIAFSGKYSYRMDSLIEYSVGFATKTGEMNHGNFDEIRIKVMAFCSDSIRNLPIVISVDNAEKGNYIWASSNIENFVGPNEWAPAFFVFPLPEIISPEDELKIYIWNPKKQTVYLDDLAIRFY